MADTIYLHGSSEVSSAGHRMVEAANQINNAVSALDSVLFNHRQAMEGFLNRFQEVLDDFAAKITAAKEA